jgi:hypothetical protein
MRQLIARLDPPAPDAVQKAANSLSYRDFISVALMIDRADVFPDNWIYIHDPSVRVGRIQNFKNWSPSMVPDQAKMEELSGLVAILHRGGVLRPLASQTAALPPRLRSLASARRTRCSTESSCGRRRRIRCTTKPTNPMLA